METNPSRGGLDLLGRLTSEPGQALEEIVSKPHLVSGALVASLTGLGLTLAGPLPWDAGFFPLGYRFLTVFFGTLVSWLGPTLVLHILSRIFNHQGSLSSALAVTGWAGAALWPALAFRLLGTGAGPLGLLTTGAIFLFYLLYYGVWWWGIQRVYGWSKGQGVVLLPVCFLVTSALSFALRLVSGIVNFVGTVFPFPS
ncbi:MAG: hypothetical protein JNK54_04485 [Elusimicrobia bacterium]|jgi:hypothetical protein|nr:hypothetical protein [Elusimicrobiota bacterium]